MKTVLVLSLLCISQVAWAAPWAQRMQVQGDEEEPEEKAEKPAYVPREPSPEYLRRKEIEEQRLLMAKIYFTEIGRAKAQARRAIVHGVPPHVGEETGCRIQNLPSSGFISPRTSFRCTRPGL